MKGTDATSDRPGPGLEFTIAAGDVDLLHSHPLLAAAPPHSSKLSSTYFDTADRIFQRAGMSLCLRTGGGRTVQTLKRRILPATGLQVRPEEEMVDEIDRTEPEPDLDQVRRHCPPALRRQIAGPLQPVFSFDVTRTGWSVPWRDSRIEVSLDEGTLRTGERAEPVRELKIDLRAGEVDALFAVAQGIAGAVALPVEVTTRPERGYRLAAGGLRDACTAEAVSLPPGATASDAFRIIAYGCLRHFARNRAAFMIAPSSEGVHQMHIGLRRLLSLFAIYDRQFSKRQRSMLQSSTRPLFKRLGNARDLDIALTSIGAAEPTGRSPVGAGLHRRREAEYQRLAALLSSKRFSQRMLDLLAFIACGFAAGAAPADRDAAGLDAEVAEMLQRQWRKLGSCGPVSRLGTKKRHRMRIRAKNFRYACEFFGDLFPGARNGRHLRAIIARLRQFQDCLGTLNDRAATHRLLHGRPHPGSGEATEKDLLRAADHLQKRLAEQRPFWS